MKQTDSSAAAAAFGVSGIPQEDPVAMYRALVDDLNRHGGWLGHRIVLLVHSFQGLDSPAQAGQAACADFTQDHRTFAVIGGFQSDTLRSCLAAKGVVHLDGPADLVEERQFPLMFDPFDMSLDRGEITKIEQLVAMHFFAGSKLGVLVQDNPTFNRVLDRSVKPELAKFHVPIASVAKYQINSSQDLASGSAQIANFVLQFRNAGVNRVISVGYNGGLVLFMRAAEQENYHPRYGLDSLDSPASEACNSSVVPSQQLVGAIGVGWLPLGDLCQGYPPFAGDAKRCLVDMKKAGQPQDSLSQDAEVSLCDAVFFLTYALQSGGRLTGAALRAGAQSLGSVTQPYAPWSTFGVRFTAGRTDGARAIRRLAYHGSSDGFVYTSDVIPVG